MLQTNLPLPTGSLLGRYRDEGHFTDCYAYDVGKTVALSGFIEAFYTTGPFRLERQILKFAVKAPSSHNDVKALAAGETDTFAAWKVEAREPDQILLNAGTTRSWLKVAARAEAATRLYFGSAVLKTNTGSDGAKTLKPTYQALMGFHALYSRILLTSAAKSLAL
ncbi:MAG: hypothetical protein AAF337_04965 [Pseudomonadota bacterium]